MLDRVLEKMNSYILTKKAYRKYDGEIKQCLDILNRDKILQIHGMRYCGKSEMISQIIQKTQIQDRFFYFCPSIDTAHSIKNAGDLKLLLDYRNRIGKPVTLIVLEDCNSIEDIKQFISNIYKSQKYTIIIVGNNIKIDGIKKVQLFPYNLSGTQKELLNFGGLPHVRVVPDISYKKTILEAMSYTLFEKDIFIPYHIKNTENYRTLLSLLAGCKLSVSVREIQRLLTEKEVSISLISLIEYINISLTNKVIEKQEVYDFKRNTAVHTSVQYQFTDIGIRSILSDFDTLNYSNILFNEFYSRGYRVYSGKNGSCIFDIYALRQDMKIGALYCDSYDKNEVRKTARKLSKVPGLTHRYVIVPSKEKLAIRKFFENGVQICELDELFNSIS